MNQIHFNTLTIKNFFSIGAEIEIDFNTYQGMNYVYGFNKDLNVKNGSGKCVDASTEIEISIEDPEVKKLYDDFINNGNK